jgi:uncharacterized protein (DUF362 family)
MEKVYIIDAQNYDPKRIADAVSKAAEALNMSLGEKTVVLLADCPWAHPKYAPHAHTRPQFIQGVANVFRNAEFKIVANSLTGFPTGYSFRYAEYGPIASQLKAQLIPLDEAATQKVAIKDGKVIAAAKLPSLWMNADLRVAMPKLRQSTLVPFAGALRQLQSLLPQDEQLNESHRLPEKMIDLIQAIPLDLIVVDAIQVLHKGGELSGVPLDLGMIIVGTNPVAVDMICAIALGLNPEEVNFLREAKERGLAPSGLDQIQILGDLTLSDLQTRSAKVELADSNPVNFPLPAQVKVIRSEKARQPGVSGVLVDVLYMLKNAGISMKSAPQTAIVIGAVDEIPRGENEYSTLIFMDDTSRGDVTGYGRIIRFAGRNIALSQVLKDLPYAIKAVNVQAELGIDFMVAKFMTTLRRLVPKK